MIHTAKQQLLKYQFVENYFRRKRGWPELSAGPNGKKILVINPHWDDDIIGCFGTLYPVRDKVSLACINEKDNPKLKRPYREIDMTNDYDTIFLPAPWDDHPDHVEASKVPIIPSVEVWLYQVYVPYTVNTVVDITDIIDEKAEALRQVNMQTNDRDWKHYALGRDAYAARHLHMKGQRYAELFLVLPAKEYIEFHKEFFACCKS